MFDPSEYGYVLNQSFDKSRLRKLLLQFEDSVKRESDKKLAFDLRTQLLDKSPPAIEKTTFKQLARWCKTDGIYSDGMDIAQRISERLFGRVIDRRSVDTSTITETPP